MIAKVGIAILALATVVLFAIAAIHNNDLFWGDRTILPGNGFSPGSISEVLPE